jgi:hypothetical protein
MGESPGCSELQPSFRFKTSDNVKLTEAGYRALTRSIFGAEMEKKPHGTRGIPLPSEAPSLMRQVIVFAAVFLPFTPSDSL